MTRDDTGKHSWVIVAGGLFLLAACVALVVLSSRFTYGSPTGERPYLLVVGVMMGAGAVYCAVVFFLHKTRCNGFLLGWILAIGVVCRVCMFFSEPIQEDDFYRYLWDGAVTATGHNPYPYIPDEILDGGVESGIPEELRELSLDSGDVFSRINHSDLATIYPPVAQAAFASAYFLNPWSLTAWRIVLFVFDAAGLVVLILLLKTFGKPVQYAAIYWWNPVLIKETYNSGHMDVLLVPFALLALLFVVTNKPVRSGLALVLAAGVKLWPLLLAPVLLRGLRAQGQALTIAITCSASALAIIAAPMIAGLALGRESGFVAYGERWEMNDALFMIIGKFSQIVSTPFGAGEDTVGTVARLMAVALILLWTGYWAWKGTRTREQLCDSLVLVVGALFMLSPTQFPWYYLWIVPFLALSPRPSLLCLSVMLPLYYLKFYFDLQGNIDFFHNGVVWIEYAPVFILAIWEWRTRWKTTSFDEIPSHA